MTQLLLSNKLDKKSEEFFCAAPNLCAATSDLLYQPQMIGEGDCGAIGGMKIGRESELLGENLPQCQFAHQKFHMT
jgi:hypothetical protein